VIPPRPAAPPRFTRRDAVSAGAGALSLGTGLFILRRVLLPSRLSPEERETFAAVLDVLLPDGTFPGHRATGVLAPLLSELESRRQTRRALADGVRLLDREARARGAASFRALPEPAGAEILERWSSEETGTIRRFFFQVVRGRAMELHYAHPASWKPLRFGGPPQPDGHFDYAEPPRA